DLHSQLENRMRPRFQPPSFFNFHFSIFNFQSSLPRTPPAPPLRRGGDIRDATALSFARSASYSSLRVTAIGLIITLIAALASTAFAQDAPPRSLDPRVKIELFAEHPQIVTPTGIDVDHRGRVWAVESNTHFPPAGYKGHPTDRVLVMSDTDGDGKADRIIVF